MIRDRCDPSEVRGRIGGESVAEDLYFAFEVDGLCDTEDRVIRTNWSPQLRVQGGSLGRGRGFLVIFRTDVFHDREFPG